MTTAGLEDRVASIVQFPSEFELPPGTQADLLDAAEAVKREYRNSIRWKLLRCRQVTSILDHPDEAIFALDVGQSVEFDWTWVGAVAFRSESIDSFDGKDGSFATESDVSESSWSGEVVEFDEPN